MYVLYSLSRQLKLALVNHVVVLFLMFCFPWRLSLYTPLPTVIKYSFSLTAFPELAVSGIFDEDHLQWHEVVWHNQFDLHFPDNH